MSLFRYDLSVGHVSLRGGGGGGGGSHLSSKKFITEMGKRTSYKSKENGKGG